MKGRAMVRLGMNTGKKFKHDSLVAWAFLLPMAIYYTIFSIIAVVFVIVLSFGTWNVLAGGFENFRFSGFTNYIEIFSEPLYLKVFGNTILMGVIILAANMVFGLFLAIMLNRGLHFQNLQRLLWYLPVVVSMAVMSDIFGKMLVNGREGTFNMILIRLGLAPVLWSESTFWMFFWIIFLTIWKSLGNTVLYYIAGLNGIPQELYEVGKIEGCNVWQKFVYITLPMLKPMISFIFITSLINIFNIFEQVQLISQGGPDNSTEVVMFRIYNEAFQNFNMGISSALSVIVLVIVVIITTLSMKTINIQLDA